MVFYIFYPWLPWLQDAIDSPVGSVLSKSMENVFMGFTYGMFNTPSLPPHPGLSHPGLSYPGLSYPGLSHHGLSHPGLFVHMI